MSSSAAQTTSPEQEEDDAETNEELYQRFTTLVSSWPATRGLSGFQFYRHEHGWHSSLGPLVGAMVADACFAARPSDIVVTTLPKCGTTWIKALLYSTVHRKEHPVLVRNGSPGVGEGDHPLDLLGPHECIPFLEYQIYTRNRVPDLGRLPDPRMFATHIPFVSLPRSLAASGCKIVYVCRDPKDALISQWDFVNKLKVRDGMEPFSVEAAAGLYCDGLSPAGPYWDHVLGYWRAHLAHPERVLFFRYEEMSRDPAAHVRRLAEFVGRPFDAAEEDAGTVDAIVRLCSFENMKQLGATKQGKTKLVVGALENNWFFRRGLVGDWENHLSPETARKIDSISEDRFRDAGLHV